jgi:hypothetical protein
VGYDRAEIASLNILSLLDESDLAKGVEEFAEIVRTGQQNFVGEHTFEDEKRLPDFRGNARASLVYPQRNALRRFGHCPGHHPAPDGGNAAAAPVRRRDQRSVQQRPLRLPYDRRRRIFSRINDTELKWLGYGREDIASAGKNGAT